MEARLPEQLRECASRAGRALSPEQSDLVVRYLQLLARWNQTINLTALPLEDFPPSSLDRLIGEPMAASERVPTTGKWFDLGSGGGSPAVPLKVLRPGLELTMVESRERKSAFLREIVRELELETADVLCQRFELLGASVPPGSADLVTVRAVRLDANLVGAGRYLLRSGGTLLMFSGQLEAPSTFGGFSLKGMLPLETTGSVLLEYRAH